MSHDEAHWCECPGVEFVDSLPSRATFKTVNIGPFSESLLDQLATHLNHMFAAMSKAGYRRPRCFARFVWPFPLTSQVHEQRLRLQLSTPLPGFSKPHIVDHGEISYLVSELRNTIATSVQALSSNSVIVIEELANHAPEAAIEWFSSVAGEIDERAVEVWIERSVASIVLRLVDLNGEGNYVVQLFMKSWLSDRLRPLLTDAFGIQEP